MKKATQPARAIRKAPSLRETLARQGIESSSARIDRVNEARLERVVATKIAALHKVKTS